MRALLGWVLALGLVVSPMVAKAGGAAAEDNVTAAAAKPAATNPGTAANGAAPAKTDASSLEVELDELRDLLQSQSKEIQQQSEQIKQQQERMQALESKVKSGNAPAGISAMPGSAAAPSSAPSSTSSPVLAASVAAPAATPKPIAAAPQGEEKPSPLYFSIGSAHFTPVGFMDLTNFFRTKGLGTGIGSTFSSVPFNNSFPQAGLTEDRFSAQNSRIGMRVDSKVAGGDAVGYVEADFLGVTNDNIYVTSNSNSLRMRLYFVDYRKGKFELFGGQDWSMLTSNRTGIGFMPGDVFNTQDVDTNYNVGLVWERTAQVRFVYHPTKTLAFGLSLENPEQYIGSAVTQPAGFPGFGTAAAPTNNPQTDQNNSINNTALAANSLAVPNVHPDVILKAAADPKFGSHSAHFEVSGLYRTFRISNAISATNNLGNTTLSAGAGAFNSNFEIFKNFRIFENAYWSSGGGRDIGSSNVPDFIIRPPATGAGTPTAGNLYRLSPIHSGAGILGFEWQTTPKLMLYGYYGAVYVAKNTALVSGSPQPSCSTLGSTCVGYGFAGGSNSQDRSIQEPTLGFTQVFWRSANLGALSLMVQGSYLTRSPWYYNAAPAANGSANAHLAMGYVNLRYTLP